VINQPNPLPIVAYFSMEIGLDPAMPTYSGGLGVLAGDALRAAADLGLPMVAVTLLHRKGHFRQHLDSSGNQTESPSLWSPEERLRPMSPAISITIEGREVKVRAWSYLVRGLSGHTVPVYLLDTALPQNTPWDQTITDYLYGGDSHYRLCQEVVLGMGGVKILRALGYDRVHAFHMNEGHSSLLGLALLEEQTWGRGLSTLTPGHLERVRQRCVFTTHTPVAAGHDQFPMELATQVLGKEAMKTLWEAECCLDGTLNMTHLALTLSRYVNGVALSHRHTTRDMYANPGIEAITNGVHTDTWTSAPFQRLYDKHISEWRSDNVYLRYAVGIPLDEILEAHKEAKAQLLAEVEKRTGVRFDPKVMTLGFARRATAYKRHDLLFTDLDRLKRIAQRIGPIQVIYGGKTHAQDEPGKEMIRRVFHGAAALRDAVPVVYMEDYDMALAKYICSGVDLWLSTPRKPLEASGTSGMKAALNGVPSLSTLDGWWVEGHVEGVTGWAIEDGGRSDADSAEEAVSIYDKLEYVVLPMFYSRPKAFAEVMRSTIALNGSFFNAQRMMRQYMENAYKIDLNGTTV